MNPLAILFLIVVAIPLLVFLLIVVREHRHSRTGVAALRAVAKERGWQEESNADESVLSRVRGQTDGVGWKLEVRRPLAAARVHAPPFLLWTAERLKSTGEVMLVARSRVLTPRMNRRNVVGFALRDVTLPALLGPTVGMKAQDYRTLDMSKAGSDPLRVDYAILATSDHAVRDFMSPTRQHALVLWAADSGASKHAIYVIRWRYAAQIMVEGPIERATVERLAALGERFALDRVV